MTEENYNYRTSQKLLRNQFPGKGKLKIPIIPKFQESPGDFDDLLLIGFDKTHLEDQNHLDRIFLFLFSTVLLYTIRHILGQSWWNSIAYCKFDICFRTREIKSIRESLNIATLACR